VVSVKQRRRRVGDIVLVLWGKKKVRARVLEVWGDSVGHMRVQLLFENVDDPIVLLIRESWLVDTAA